MWLAELLICSIQCSNGLIQGNLTVLVALKLSTNFDIISSFSILHTGLSQDIYREISISFIEFFRNGFKIENTRYFIEVSKAQNYRYQETRYFRTISRYLFNTSVRCTKVSKILDIYRELSILSSFSI